MERALAELEHYLQLAGGKLDPDAEPRARKVLAYADRRIRAGEQTVAALAGATGSGKSSLFNAISGTSFATVAARRPTTSQPLAVSFAASNKPLLDLLRIPRRQEAPPPVQGMADVVLVDLPDHDSTVAAHREEVDRMVGLVDQFIFVVDPQKYADNALHERYLRPLAGHRDVITVVLNHADKLTDGDPLYLEEGMDPRVGDIVEHLRKLLAADGLEGVPVFATSAMTGEGIPELRQYLGRVASSKRATRERLTADLRRVHDDLQAAGGRAVGLQEDAVDHLKREITVAAGVPRMAKGVRAAVKHKGAMVQGWRASGVPEALELPSHQVASAADDARASGAIRSFVTQSTAELPPLWREEARRRILGGPGKQLPARVDAAMRAVDLTDMESPFGWGLVRTLKWLPVIAVLGIAGWVAYEIFFGLGDFAPRIITILVAALVIIVLLSFFGDAVLRWSARRAERTTAKRLGTVAEREVEDTVVAAVQAELDAHHEAESALERMAGILARD